MPPPCNRCRQCPPAEGDTWCLACTGWEALGRDLAGTWDSPGCRAIAADLVVSCVRQVRALRSLGAGLARAPGLAAEAGGNRTHGAGTSRARSEVPLAVTPKSAAKGNREELPRRRSERGRTPPPPIAKDEVSDREEADDDGESEEEEHEEVEEEEVPPNTSHVPLTGGHRRPPEPPGSPSRRGSERGGDRHRSAAHSHRGSTRSGRDQHREERDRDRTRSGRRRGGRKHQRLYRLAVDPNTPVHRKPSEDFWKLSSSLLGQQALGRY